MSTFGSIRGVPAVTSAFSLAMISFNTSNSTLTSLKSNLQQVEREMKLTTDPETWRELADEAGVLKEKIKEVNDQVEQTKITNLLNFGAAIGVIGSSVLTAATKIARALAEGGALAKVLSWAKNLIRLGPCLALVGFAIGAILGTSYSSGQRARISALDNGSFHMGQVL